MPSSYASGHDAELTGEVSPVIPGRFDDPVTRQTPGPAVALGGVVAEDEQAPTAEEEIYREELTPGERIVCRVAQNGLALHLPGSGHTMWLVACAGVCWLGFMAVVSITAAITYDWSVQKALLYFLLGAVAGLMLFGPLLWFATRDLFRKTNVLIEPKRLVIESQLFGREEVKRFVLDGFSRADVLHWGPKAVITLRTTTGGASLGSSPSTKDSMWLFNRINRFLDEHRPEGKWSKKPSPSDPRLLCEAQGDRLALWLPPGSWKWTAVCWLNGVGLLGFAGFWLWESRLEAIGPMAFSGFFAAIGIGMIYLGVRDKLRKTRVMVGPNELVVQTDFFGRRGHKQYPLDAKSQALLTRHSMILATILSMSEFDLGVEVKYSISITPTGKSARFGHLLTRQDQDWIVNRINRHLQPAGVRD